MQRWCTGPTQDVADAEGVGAKKVRLEDHQTLFPGRRAENDFQAWHALLDEQRNARRTRLRARAADRANYHRMTASGPQQFRVADGAVRLGANRWWKLAGDDQLTPRSALEQRTLGRSVGIERLLARCDNGVVPHACDGPRRLNRPPHAAHR